MNSFDTAVAKRLKQFIDRERKASEDILLLGVCGDFTEYQSRVARIKAFNDVLTEVGEIEAELKRG
jgi:hypothetical protein